MIRIISFRGTAAKDVITYSSITGGISIPFYSSLLEQSLPKRNLTFFNGFVLSVYSEETAVRPVYRFGIFCLKK